MSDIAYWQEKVYYWFCRTEKAEAEVEKLRAEVENLCKRQRDEFEAWIAMGRAEEREACAQLLEEVGEKEKRQSYSTATFWAANSLLRGAGLIRARGEGGEK